MANDQQSASGRVADRDKTTLIVGMIGIFKGRGERIIEYGHGFVERHAVLLDVRRGFVAVPLEAHRTIITCVVSSMRLTPRSAAGGRAPRAPGPFERDVGAIHGSMMGSALSSTAGGIASPSVFAVFILMTSSSLLGCSRKSMMRSGPSTSATSSWRASMNATTSPGREGAARSDFGGIQVWPRSSSSLYGPERDASSPRVDRKARSSFGNINRDTASARLICDCSRAKSDSSIAIALSASRPDCDLTTGSA